MPQSPPGRKELPLRALSFLFDRRRKSLLASTTHPVPHSAPLQSSVIAGPMRRAIVDSRRADSLSLSVARARNYPMCENSTRYNRTRNFGLYGHAESKKTQKFAFRSALRPNQISFSHGQDPKEPLARLLKPDSVTFCDSPVPEAQSVTHERHTYSIRVDWT